MFLLLTIRKGGEVKVPWVPSPTVKPAVALGLGTVFKASDPPISLLIGRLSSVASCQVVTTSWLIIKRGAGQGPIMEVCIFKVESTRLAS